MTAITDKTVREFALENPTATRVFEKLGIDYCCGGNRSLQEACRVANLDIHQVVDSLDNAERAAHPVTRSREWQLESLADLIEHIKNTHHKYTREELARLGPLLDKVCSAHGEKHPELLHIREIFQGLAQELSTHLMKEEMVLFPYIAKMEESTMENKPAVQAPFGTVQNPVSMMEHEHDSAGSALRAMRDRSSGYSAPTGACVSFQTLYQALDAFEADLHQHIHLENNILFPRAIAMEKAY
jgi:regulator of cell morphogenesis and NO signaling